MAVRLPGPALGLDRTPVRDDVRPLTVDVQPGQRLIERAPVEQSALGALRCLNVEQLRLGRQDLVKPLDVPAGDRQNAQLHAALQRIGRKALAAPSQSDGDQESSRQDGVGQRFRCRFELGAVTIQAGH